MKKRVGRKVSDIVPRRRAEVHIRERRVSAEPKLPERVTPKAPQPAETAPTPKKQAPEPGFFSIPPREVRIDAGVPPLLEKEIEKSGEGEVRRRPRRRGLRVFIIAFVVLAAAGAGAWRFLPKAAVALTMKKYPVTFSETVVVAADPRTVVGGTAVVVPGEALEARANLSLPFRASATETVSAKATGKLTIYNAFSSNPQRLVANTRFESPDKKIFRIPREVIVPGARVENRNLVPASVEVLAVAEEPGEAYNLPPSSGWRLPGFAGRPQYEGFYAEAKEGMKGGFIGERAKPSAVELANARADLIAALTDALEGQFLIILSDRFTALPGSRRVTLLREEVSADAEDPHLFHLFGEARMEQIVFEEPTLKELLIARASRDLPGELTARTFTYTLGTSTPDFSRRTLTFTASGEGVFTEPFDVDAFRASVAGKGEADFKAAVFAIPGVEAARVSLSPFFVRTVPRDPERIEVEVE